MRHVVSIGVCVGFVNADEDQQTRPNLRHNAPLHLQIAILRW